jgi:hypothetical protein
MTTSRDLTEQEQRQGSVGGVSPNEKNYNKTINNIKNLGVSSPIEVLNREQDMQWAYEYGGASQDFNTYYDYYYSGQDIQVSIEGAGSNSTGGIIPIVSFAFNIKQEKLPLYGFWSYTFDAIMRGNRIVNGAFTIATSSLNYMKDLLSEAAVNRAEQDGGMHRIRGLDMDEKNISEYWGRNIDSATMVETDTRHIWSSHPPFNFIIVYGVQNVSAPNMYQDSTYKEALQKYKNSPSLMTDTNERLVSRELIPSRLVIENVELTSMQIEYTPDGQPLGETYSFLARDLSSYDK